MKIGRNAPCPCGSGKKYKKCCLEKEEIKKDSLDFIEKMMTGFRKFNIKFEGSFLEEPIRDNLESLYFQCRYIYEKLDKTILLGTSPDKKKHLIIYRKANIIKKLLWSPSNREVKNGKMFFQWGKHTEEIDPNEYIDLIIDIFASIFEYYVNSLRKNKIFDTVKLAQGLGLSHLIKKKIITEELIKVNPKKKSVRISFLRKEISRTISESKYKLIITNNKINKLKTIHLLLPIFLQTLNYLNNFRKTMKLLRNSKSEIVHKVLCVHKLSMNCLLHLSLIKIIRNKH